MQTLEENLEVYKIKNCFKWQFLSNYENNDKSEHLLEICWDLLQLPNTMNTIPIEFRSVIETKIIYT